MIERDRQMRVFREKLSELERHNPARKGHGERVASHAVATAFELGVRDDELFATRIASALHEFGKTRLPREMLERPGLLEPNEIVEIRARVTGLASTIAIALGIPEVEATIASQYERFDGLGFPGRPKGVEIPIGGRIVALCSAFDVMTHTQPWRQSKSEEDAIADIVRNSGTQFDPDVVAAFLKVQPLITPLEENVF